MKRWKKILLVTLAALVVVLVGGYLYIFQLGGLESLVNNQVHKMIAGGRYPIEVQIGRIKGDYFSNIELERINVAYSDSLYHYRMLYVPRMKLSYSLANLWDKKYIFDFISIDSASIMLMQDENGRYLLPTVSRDDREDTLSQEVPVLSIDRLNINYANLLLVRPGDTLTFDDILLDLSVRSEEETYSINVRRFNFRSNLEEIALGSGGGRLTYSENNLVFQDIAFTSDNTRMKLTGIIELKAVTGHVEFAFDHIKLDELSRFGGPGLKGLVDVTGSLTFDSTALFGTVDLAGELFFARFENLFIDFYFADKRLVFDTLYGTIFDNCSVDGKGGIDFSGSMERYQINADIRNLNLEKFITDDLPSDLSGHIYLNGTSFRSASLFLDIDADLYESSFNDYPFHTAKGKLSITTDSINFIEPFEITYFENNFDISGKIDYSHDVRLDVRAELNNLDRYRGKLFIDQPGGRGEAEVSLTGLTRDPDMKGYFFSDSIWIYGLFADSLYADIDIERFLYGQQGDVKVHFKDGTAWDIPYDTGYSRLVLDSNYVTIDSATVWNRYTTLDARGVLNHGDYPRKMVLNRLVLSAVEQSFSNQGNIYFEIDSAGFNFIDAAIGNVQALLSVKGRVDYDESMNMKISVKDLPIEPWRTFFEADYPVDGYLSCEADLGGTFLKPCFTLSGSIDSLSYFDAHNTGDTINLGDLTYAVRYSDIQVMFDSLRIVSEAGRYFAQGYFNVDLAFTNDGNIERLPDLPMDIQITASDTLFDLVSVIMPSVEYLYGDFYANFRLSGTPGEPHLEGGAYLNNARLKYFDLADLIYTDTARVTMADNSILIDGIEAYVLNKRRGNRKSYALIDGAITVKSLDNFHYNLDISLPKEFPFKYELDDIEGVVEGDLHVEGDTPPLVTGDLTLLSTKYYVNFAEPDEGSPILSALSGDDVWDLNLNIDILSNYWIKNDDIDAEFAGEINLIREKGKYRFIGEMEILRGKGYLFDKTFTLEEGSTVTFEDIEYPNPALNITASTRIPGVRFQENEDNTPEQIELVIDITGTLDEPELNPAEGSEFSKEDILPLIVMNYYSGDSTEATGAIEERVTQLLASNVSRITTRKLGIETFEIDPVYENGSISKTKVTFGAYDPSFGLLNLGMLNDVYVYTKFNPEGNEIGFEYRISRNFILEGRKDEDELYHVDLKLHWEFE
ncbi:MAG: translocation/assembly module TamB domain-containing protein [Candidatus Zixiibacteriota bacterium]